MTSWTSRSAIAALGLGLLASCDDRSLPPVGQLHVYLNTDAPLPPAPGDTLAPSDPEPLFDRARIEVFKPNETTACPECTREFDMQRTMVGKGHASVVIVPGAGASGYRARVRLFTAAWTRGGEPNPDSTIDVTVVLPPVDTDGIKEVTVVLRTDDVGKPRGRDEPLAVDVGPAQPALVGTWSGAPRVPCPAPARKGEVCVPGGAYWMGTLPNAELTVGRVGSQQRLVVLQPFYLSASEVQVGTFRDSKRASTTDPRRGGDCSYTDAPTVRDLRPVTCISWEKAREYCRSLGADLPTEAQFEYAAGGTRGHMYPWGDEQPTCDDAVFGFNVAAGDFIRYGECNVNGAVQPSGSGLRDRLRLSDADEDIVDLAGNVSEQMLDLWNDDRDGACWSTGVYRDPICLVAGAGVAPNLRSERGGDILNNVGPMRSFARSYRSEVSQFSGFRCARAVQ